MSERQVTSGEPRPPAETARRLTGKLIGRLTQDIVGGKLAPLARLPTEHALMEAYGVSRTVVREAIAALRAEGLVETRRGSGAYVTAGQHRPFRIHPDGLESVDEVLNVMELRICVEVEAAALAAERRTQDDLARLAGANQAFAEAIATGDPALDADYEFHVAVGRATGNPYFSSFLGFLGRMVIPRRTIHLPGDPVELTRYLTRLLRDHRSIERAIAARRAAAASRLMGVHLNRGRDRYRALAGKP